LFVCLDYFGGWKEIPFVSVPFCSNLIGKVAKGVNSGFLASIGAVSCFWGEKEAFTPAMIDDDLPF